MLICPQCDFDNPDGNKFCQQCGESLTQAPCPNCATLVTWDYLNCPQCGIKTGRVWLAIITGRDETSQPANQTADLGSQLLTTQNQVESDHLAGAVTTVQTSAESSLDVLSSNAADEPLVSADDIKPSELEGSAGGDSPAPELEGGDSQEAEAGAVWSTQTFDARQIPDKDALKQPEQAGQGSAIATEFPQQFLFLDPQHRYQLLKPFPPPAKGETVATLVLDCQPLQLSPLKAVQQSSETSETEIETFMIPIAQAYLALQVQYGQFFPDPQDAWQTAEYDIVLLEDYSDFPLLLNQLSQKDTTPAQIVRFLQGMADLWSALEPWHCQRSLLETSNLRVFPDAPQQLCLPRLYTDSEDVTPTLTNLGQFWKRLLQDSQRTLFGKLTELLQELSEGEIQTVDYLKQELAIALQQLSPEPNSPRATPQASTSTQIEGDLSRQAEGQQNGNEVTMQVPALVSLEAAGQTDVGKKRERNEDFFSLQTLLNYQQTPIGQVLEAKGLYILCDGMGGHAAGEVASQLAVDTLRQYFQGQWVGELPTEETLKDAIVHANNMIYELNQQDVRSGAGRMGTTLVLLVVADSQVAIAHVGDSRIYRLSATQGLKQVTVDHEVGQREIQRGVTPEVAYTRPDAYQLTQALGPRDDNFLRPDVQFIDLTEDTLFILASDGLTDNNLLDHSVQTHLLPLLNRDVSLKAGAETLVKLANQHNGHDNITVILVRAVVQP
ncbi:MAG: serine/threonine phosphatase [Microcoleaceae cyanobacterium]